MGLEASVAWLMWIAGIVLITLAVFRVRVPFGRMQELDRLAENSRRYDSWRGGRRTAADGGGESGADVMRDVMRRQVMTWAGVGVAGVVLILLGFVIR